MKARAGFVSNSSSSSFVVIGSVGDCSGQVKAHVVDGRLHLGVHGETDFGWGPDTIYDVFSRINFAKLQSNYDTEWEDMLEAVLKEVTGCEEITWDLDGYIDHQSNASEGENTEIFDDEDSLKRFLFCEDSLIELDNDNR